jgi:hypothetical protein
MWTVSPCFAEARQNHLADAVLGATAHHTMA